MFIYMNILVFNLIQKNSSTISIFYGITTIVMVKLHHKKKMWKLIQKLSSFLVGVETVCHDYYNRQPVGVH